MAGVDLATAPFWIFVGVATAVMPLCRGRLRAWAWAGLCLAFCGVVIDGRLSGGVALLAFDVGSFLLLPLVALLGGLVAIDRMPSARQRAAAAVVVGVCVGAAFVLHKRPELAGAGFGDLGPVMGTIGFSYVALRAIDLLRAVAQRRVSRPTFAGVVGYLLPIHMLAAGPIAAAEEHFTAPAPAPPDLEVALGGVERIAAGLFKKFVVAALLRQVLLTDFAARGPYLWLEVQLFYLWVYLDFSALADIAVGVGRLCGMPAPENFDRPLTARNLVVFWERWHISLSQFARRNLFIPLQLASMRRTRGRHRVAVAAVALALTFVAIGLWHGLSWGFLAWGGMHAAGVVACHLWQHWLRARLGAAGHRRYLQRPVVRIVATVLTFEYVAVSLALVKTVWMVPG
jgi:D-alanyl-lipoteichoic acid acyltransferase DltB (MBOAT superfamily)